MLYCSFCRVLLDFCYLGTVFFYILYIYNLRTDGVKETGRVLLSEPKISRMTFMAHRRPRPSCIYGYTLFL